MTFGEQKLVTKDDYINSVSYLIGGELKRGLKTISLLTELRIGKNNIKSFKRCSEFSGYAIG